MKLTKVTLQWDSGAVTEHADPKGIDFGDILGMATGDVEPASFGALLQSLLTGGIGLLIKKFGLSI